MNIGIVCSGGDAPGMNAALKKFVDMCAETGHEAYFVYDGYEGMIDGHIKKAAFNDVSGILHRGGTIIRSSRSKRFFEYEYRKKAYENLKKHNISHLLVLGGDGSFRGLNKMAQEFDITFTGIPATIDNDISFSDYAIGVDTALNVIRDAVDNIRDTASSFRRAFVIETMGRECGYLAAVSAAANGAEICMIPEIEFNWEENEKRLKKEFENGRSYLIAIIAEGCNKTKELGEWIEKKFDIEMRVTILGHIQRGGKPTVQERLIAAEFVYEALTNLDKKNMVVVRKGVDYDFVDIATLVNTKYVLDKKVINLLKYLD